MVEEGRGYAAAIALQHLLRILEAKGIMEAAETTAMLDGVLGELDNLQKNGVMSPEVNVAARKAIGIMYLSIRK
jgi:hypothetical protein